MRKLFLRVLLALTIITGLAWAWQDAGWRQLVAGPPSTVPTTSLASVPLAPNPLKTAETAIEIGLAVDISGSMGQLLPEVKRGLLGCVDSLKIGDRVALVAFCDVPQVLWQGYLKSEADRSALKAAIANLSPSSRPGTDQVEGYAKLLSALPDDGQPFARRYMVVASDAYADTADGNRRQWERVDFNALAHEISLRLFYYNNQRDVDFLRLLASKGVRFRVASAAESADALRDLKAEISYVHSGQWRENRPGKAGHPARRPAPVPARDRRGWRHWLAASFLSLGALGALLLTVVTLKQRQGRQQAWAEWEEEKARSTQALAAAVPDREVLRLWLPGENRFFERPLTPASAFTFGTQPGLDFVFPAPAGVTVDGAIEVGADGGLSLVNRASAFSFEVDTAADAALMGAAPRRVTANAHAPNAQAVGGAVGPGAIGQGATGQRPGLRPHQRQPLDLTPGAQVRIHLARQMAPHLVLQVRRESAPDGGTNSLEELVRMARAQRQGAAHPDAAQPQGAALP